MIIHDDNVISNVYYGDKEISKIYSGASLVYGKPTGQWVSESGNPVVCHPFANYPLGITAHWQPTQSGTGDPSPDNIRPIIGRESVTVTLCGANLCDFPDLQNVNINDVYNKFNKILPHTFPARSTIAATIATDDAVQKFGIYVVYTDGTDDYRWLKTKNIIVSSATTAATKTVKTLEFAYSTGFTLSIYNTMLVAGDTAPSEYQPYTGQTITLQLPQTIYGGSVNAVTGDGQTEWKTIVLTGAERVYSRDRYNLFELNVILPERASTNVAICSHWNGNRTADKNALYAENQNINIGYATCGSDDVDALKSYLAAQYAAGTPVQIAYKLATPIPFTATGAQPINALSGTNTILTDADSVDVSYFCNLDTTEAELTTLYNEDLQEVLSYDI